MGRAFGSVIVPTSDPVTIGSKGIVHDRISPDANFRYPPRPPPAKTHRQFSPRQRAYRCDATGYRVNSGDISFDAPTSRSDLNSPRSCTTRCRCRAGICPGNHDVGDNPTAVGAAPKRPATEKERQNYLSVIGEDRWRFDAAGWCFIGLNSLIMNTGIESEAGQFGWLTAELARVNGRPVALFLHKPLYLNAPDDPETESSAIRYVPQPRRKELIELLSSVDLRLVASGHIHQRRDFTCRHTRHVWAPSTGVILPGKDSADHRRQGSRAGGVSLSARRF